MRLVLALAAIGSLAACSSNNTNDQPAPETGQVSTDTMQTTRTPSGTIDTANTASDTAGRRPSDTAYVGAEPSGPKADTTSIRHDSL